MHWRAIKHPQEREEQGLISDIAGAAIEREGTRPRSR